MSKSDSVRQCQRESFNECMMNYTPFTQLDKKTRDFIILKLERGCYNANIERANQNHIPTYWDNPVFVEQYETICYNAKVNLDPESNINRSLDSTMKNYLVIRVYNSAIVDLLSKIWFKKNYSISSLKVLVSRMPYIRPESVGCMSSIDMNPAISRKIIEDIALRGKQTINAKYTTMYKCPKYGHAQATIRSQQTRAGDEGVTHFLRCLICGDRWTI
jgi:DNA-directed RNA polymerase subunit M/transcription elongation factor TFIIS